MDVLMIKNAGAIKDVKSIIPLPTIHYCNGQPGIVTTRNKGDGPLLLSPVN